MLDTSTNEALNLPYSNYPPIEDSEQYRRCLEVQRQRCDEHANLVLQANQARAENGRQQFLERMQRCPPGPPKRLSSRTPPPEFKLPVQSPLQQQWVDHPLPKKSSPDTNLIIKQSNGMSPDQRQQFIPPVNSSYNQHSANNFNPLFHDPRYLHYQQQPFQAFCNQKIQYGAHFNATQLPLAPFSYDQQQPDLARLHMLHQQQWQQCEMPNMQQTMVIPSTSINQIQPKQPPIPVATLIPTQNDPVHIPQQKTGSPVLQHRNQPVYWNMNQFNAPGQPTSAFNNTQPLNFISHSSSSITILKEKAIQEGPSTGSNNSVMKMAFSNQGYEDDILELCGTIGEGVEMNKYIGSISDIESYSFAQIGNTAERHQSTKNN